MIVRILVWTRDEVPDYVGKATQERLQDEGFSEVRSVRAGRVLDVEFEGVEIAGVKSKVEALCQDMLANTSSEKFEFAIIDED